MVEKFKETGEQVCAATQLARISNESIRSIEEQYVSTGLFRTEN
jgi:hypothetical protein